MRLAVALGIEFNVDAPRRVYSRGWGFDCLNSHPIMCSWTITIQDLNDRPTEITFDLFKDSSPLVIGLDLKRYTSTDNFRHELIIKRPKDKQARILRTYITGDSSVDYRVRAELVKMPRSYALTQSHIGDRPATIVKRLHRLTHAPEKEMMGILRGAGILSEQMKKVVTEVAQSCEICAKSGPPSVSRKLSVSHINQAFNEEVQMDFMYCMIRGTRHVVIHFVDSGTAFSEAVIVPGRHMDVIIGAIEKEWINRHGAPRFMSGDDEFDGTKKKKLGAFLESRNIGMKARPVRRHNKLGIVERKHATIKRILERLQLDKSETSDSILLSRAVFFSNCFCGSHLLSSFQLAKGYAPSLLGLPARIIDNELLQAHKEQQAVRALQRVARTRSANENPHYNPGDHVYFFYRSSKQNEQDEWKRGIVKSSERYYVNITIEESQRTTKVAYEDLRLRPQSQLTRELMDSSVEFYLGMADGGESQQPGSQALTSATQKVFGNGTNNSVKDIGEYAQHPSSGSLADRSLGTSEQLVLRHINEKIGGRQVTEREIEFAPEWLLQKAVVKEYRDNWESAYKKIEWKEIPRDGNIISSHVVYKVKKSETGEQSMKARLVLHGNRDDKKEEIRKDSSAADMMVTRLILSLSTILRFTVGVADIKGAYMQSGPIGRDLYVRPPGKMAALSGNPKALWHLVKLPYGVVEASRQWLKTSDEWLLEDTRMKRASGIHQLFVRRNTSGIIDLLVAKTSDDFLVSGNKTTVENFFSRLKSRFEVGKAIIASVMKFNGCEIVIEKDGGIVLNMNEYIERLKPVELSRTRRKQIDQLATADENSMYRALAGTLMYLGNGTLPQAALATSLMQQRLGRLMVSHIVEGNKLLHELLKLESKITFRPPDQNAEGTVTTFSDASHGGRESSYGQTGGISGLMMLEDKTGNPIFHAIGWTSHKQKRISHSSFGAEIIACGDMDERGHFIREALRDLFPSSGIKHELCVDSRALFDTVTTLHESKEFRLRPTVTRIRDSFESGELDTLRWVAGIDNVADTLTKANLTLFGKLNNVLASGVWSISMNRTTALNSEEWR